MNDVLLVARELEIEHAVLLAGGSGPAATAILLAATNPELVRGLVLVNASARFLRADDYPMGWSLERSEETLQRLEESWTEPENPLLGLGTQDRGETEATLFSIAMSASPSRAKRFHELNRSVDVRSVLHEVSVPTLVIARSAAQANLGPPSAKYISERIPGARYVEIEGGTGSYWNDPEPVMHEVETFVTGERPEPKIERALATVLFTDIVSSTATTVASGDRKWRELIDAHDRAARTEIERRNGRLISTAGDSVLATFAGPGRAIECAQAIGRRVSDLGVEVRAGLHTGEIELRGDDISGIAVNIAHRVMEIAGPGQVLVSRTVSDLSLGSEITFAEHGVHQLKGIPGDWQLYEVVSVP
jgi:class 3 adenylate cyclase